MGEAIVMDKVTGKRFGPPSRIVEEYEQLAVSEHPLFVRLASNPVNLEALWVLVANTNAGISPNFVRWLALGIARTTDERIACLLAKQLYDELGNGRFDRIHRVLLERFVAGLEPWRPKDPARRSLEPGRKLGARAGEVFDTGAPFEAIGGLMVAEVFANKMDHCLGDEIRRQSLVPKEALVWLELHEVLEENHAADSLELAALVPDQGVGLEHAWQGARKLWAAMWGFLDDVEAVAFAERPA